MAYSYLTYPGDGSTVTFAINFTLGYLSREYVKCRVGDEVDGLGDPAYRTITWINDGLVSISGAPPEPGQTVVFTRTVPKDSLIHDYSNGADIEESNLDDSNKQLLMALQEFIDGRTGTITGGLDMGGNKITNLLAGSSPSDAVTYQQVSDMIAGGIGLSNYISTAMLPVTTAVDLATARSILGVPSSASIIATYAPLVNPYFTRAGIGDSITDLYQLGKLCVYQVGSGNPAVSGTADAAVIQRISAGSVALDFGAYNTGNFWLQPRNITNLGVSYDLFVCPSGGFLRTNTPTVGDSSTKVATTQFCNPDSVLTSPTGRRKNSDGMYEMWGVTGSIAPGGFADITYPTPMPTQTIDVVPVAIGAGVYSSNIGVAVGNFSRFGFRIYNWSNAISLSFRYRAYGT